MKITLQPATESDKPYLLSLRKKTMTEHLERQGIFLCHEAHISRLEEHFQGSKIVFINRDKVGCLKYHASDERLEIMQLQIAPQHQNQGFGTAILRCLLTQHAHTPAYLTVLKGNPAIRLYRHLGFNICFEDEFEYEMVLYGANCQPPLQRYLDSI
ncbi:GNAT family N-acetyltransferase [Pseudoalteromonas luteoviolacea]|uniref:GNAT family N-acetyltransferase n=1 Tax=Pseudoalteromonas luteoviolacea TaxID=43657 RepID=UPI001B38F7A3|nr:GNAT family N-acetyltransferase [Pseudoalteromonas luteoviolacea]MBQ4838053.1 GNAT family N-acetyltransferase [Pseudoalteromonas luteoviolacea]